MKKDRTYEKEALLTDCRNNRQALLEAASAWRAERADEVFLGEWCLLDLLAHMSGWDEANLEAIDALQAGQLPAFYAHQDPDWRTFNASLVRAHRRPSLAEQLTHFEATWAKFLAALENLGAEDFYRDWGVRYHGYRVTIVRLVEAELKDEREHLEQMKSRRQGSSMP